MERERWKPLFKTDGVYNKGDKFLLFGDKGITLQTKDKIFKRKRPMENKVNQLENKLFQLGRLKKEGKKVDGLIGKTEVVLFKAVDKKLDTSLKKHPTIEFIDKFINWPIVRRELARVRKNLKDRTPEEIIFREAPLGEQTDVDLRKHATIECIEAEKMKKIRKNLKDLAEAPKQPLEDPKIYKEDGYTRLPQKEVKKDFPEMFKKKIRKDTTMSATWNKEVKKKELKKEIQGQLEDLKEKQFKLNKEKVNPYWEYTFKRPKQILLGCGCWHYGARTCDVKKIKEKVQEIKESHAAVICMGDLLENANRYSIGAGVYEQVMTPMKQMAGVVKLLEPIKSQIMVMIDGNHEFRTWKECGFKPTQIMAEKLGVPYAGFEAFVRMKVKKFTYTVYATHGSTAARFAWTRMKALEDVMRHVDADIVLMGHTHDKLYHEVRYKGIAEKKKVGVLTGSFLKDDPYGYAAMKNLPPVKTGFIVLTLEGSHWDAHGVD